MIVGIAMGQELKFALVALVNGLAGCSASASVERALGPDAGAGFVVGVVTFAPWLALGLFRSDMS